MEGKGKGRGRKGRKGKPVIDSFSELRSTHTPSAKVFFHTERTSLLP